MLILAWLSLVASRAGQRSIRERLFDELRLLVLVVAYGVRELGI